MTMLSVISSCVSVVLIGISALLLAKQIRENHDWNMRKASIESLNTLVFGEFPSLRSEFEGKLKCDIHNLEQTYANRVCSLSENEKLEIDLCLKRILNIFETLAIAIKNKVADDDTCYDYLGWIATDYYRWSKPFIDELTRKAIDSQVYRNLAERSLEWQKRMEKEREDIIRITSIPPKPKLG